MSYFVLKKGTLDGLKRKIGDGEFNLVDVGEVTHITPKSLTSTWLRLTDENPAPVAGIIKVVEGGLEEIRVVLGHPNRTNDEYTDGQKAFIDYMMGLKKPTPQTPPT